VFFLKGWVPRERAQRPYINYSKNQY